MIFPVILAGLATGLVLGLFGSGGSIIATPALLYLLNVAPKSAIAMSLGIVAITATIAALDHWKRGNVDISVAAVFGLFGVAGTYAGARLGVATPVAIQLAVFALVMYAAAWRMLKPARLAITPSGEVSVSGYTAALPCTGLFSHCMAHIALHGIGVGILTGFVGVGGGFLIVPALVLLSSIPMKTAVGTSLAIVAAKSYAGFAGYMGAVPIDWGLMGGLYGSHRGRQLRGHPARPPVFTRHAQARLRGVPAVRRHLYFAEKRRFWRISMTVTVVSKFPAGGRCTLYARYAEALSRHFGLTVDIHCPDNEPSDGPPPPAIVIRG